jgi:hypothetical protein
MPKLPATAAADGNNGPRSSSTINDTRCLNDKLPLPTAAVSPATAPPAALGGCSKPDSSSSAAQGSSRSDVAWSGADASSAVSPPAAFSFICTSFNERRLSSSVPQLAR